MNGLSAGRSSEERDQIIDTFYGRYQDRVATAPAGHVMDYVHDYLISRKDA